MPETACGREAVGDGSYGDTCGPGPTLSNPLVIRGTEGKQSRRGKYGGTDRANCD